MRERQNLLGLGDDYGTPQLKREKLEKADELLDLVAHFYRRAFNLLNSEGCFGLIATNTIGQGDTRSTGLRWICTHGGTIARLRFRLRSN